MMITLMSARVPSTVGPRYFDIMEKQLGKAGLRRFLPTLVSKIKIR